MSLIILGIVQTVLTLTAGQFVSIATKGKDKEQEWSNGEGI